ncbi:MAG: O-antigen ligase family protein [Coriobacteriia bacterium]|nr:O-antigen ligase family protein [Coriobacteriia bacterium]
MRFTILDDRRSVVMVAALVAIAALPVLSVDSADPQQPIRVLAVAAAAGLLCIIGAPRWGRYPKLATSVAAVLVAWVLLASFAGGLPAGVFGVHGRFQGLVSGATIVLAAAAGLTLPGRYGRVLGYAIAGFGVVFSGFVLVQAALGMDAVGFSNNRVVAGGWLAISLAVTLASSYVATGRDRLVLPASALFIALGLGVTGTRGAWIGALAGLVVVVYVALRTRTPRTRLVLIMSLVSVLAIIAGVTLFGVAESSAKLDPRALSSGSAASRWQIWRGAAAMTAANPVIGVGTGRFIYEFPAFQPLEHAAAEALDTRPDTAHSGPLHLAAEAGVPAALAGLVLAGLAVVGGASGVRRRDAAALIALAGFAAYLGQSLFGVAAVEVDALGWLLGGLAVSRAGSTSEETPARSPQAFRILAGVVALGVVVACVWYLRADNDFADSSRALAAGDTRTAARAAAAAVVGNPLVDVHRVAQADAVLYEPVPAVRAVELPDAQAAVARGLEMEPDSYDLMLARARLIATADSSPDEIADAYLMAVKRYPLGVEVRVAASNALRDAGRTDEAAAIDAALAALESAREAR